MINAVLKEKADIQRNEDVKTSSIIGLLTLLPAELFWKLLKSSLSEQNGYLCHLEIYWLSSFGLIGMLVTQTLK